MSKRIAEMQLSGFDSGVTFNSDEMGDDIIWWNFQKLHLVHM
jgi:hypothetical protein